jgi:hypothetical protein
MRAGAGSVALRVLRLSWGETDDWMKAVIEALRKGIKRMHYPLEVMLTCPSCACRAHGRKLQ